MKEVRVTISLSVNDDYLQDDIDDIVDGFQDMIEMTDPDEITFNTGYIEFI